MSQHITLLLSSITFLVGGLPIVDVSIFSDPDQNLGIFLDPDPNIMYGTGTYWIHNTCFMSAFMIVNKIEFFVKVI